MKFLRILLLPLCALLLQACDKPDEVALEQLERDGFQFTAQDFVKVATQGDDVNLENFITAGIDVNARNPENYTALMGAAERGNLNTLNLLINAGANIDQQGKDGWSPLMLASLNNHAAVVSRLVEAGANSDLHDNNGWTALMQAVYQGHDKVVGILAPTSHEGLDRALLVAALMGHNRVIEILLEAGADINASTEDGETALMLAAQKERPDTVRLLLDKGALKSVRNNIGETAEVIARSKGYNEISALIAEATITSPDPAPAATPAATPAAEEPAATAQVPIAPSESDLSATPVTAATATTVAPVVPAADTDPAPTAPAPRSVEAPETAWFDLHQLDLNDPAMLDADPDGDGFTNRDEYLSDTNPHDAASRPPMVTRLRLADTGDDRLPLVLQSVSGSTAQLRDTSSGETHRLSSGQSVPGFPYTVERVRSRAHSDKTSDGKVVDVSEIILRHQSTGKELTLVRGLSTRAGAGNAHLYLEGKGQTITARQGESFTLPDDGDRQYEIVDIRPDQAVIRDKTSGQVFTVNPAP